MKCFESWVACSALITCLCVCFLQATHYSFLATLEVLGKLVFSALVGSLVDWVGFASAFCLFLFLSLTSVLYIWQASPIRR